MHPYSETEINHDPHIECAECGADLTYAEDFVEVVNTGEKICLPCCERLSQPAPREAYDF